MPDIEEVFRLSTKNLHREPGAMDRQVQKQRKAARNRKLGALAVVGVVIAVAGAAVALNGGGTKDVPTSPVPTSAAPVFTTKPVTSSLIDLQTGAVTPLPESIASMDGDAYAVSPDRTQVAFVAGALYVANIDGTNIHQVSPPGVGAFGVQWSPDGTELVYQQREATGTKLGNIYVIDLAASTERQITNLDQSQNWGWWFLFPSFAPDGQSVLYQLPSGDQRHAVWNLWTAPVTGGRNHMLLANAGWGALRGTSDQNLAYVTPIDPSGFQGGQLKIQDTAIPAGLGNVPNVLAKGGAIYWVRWSPDHSRIAFSQHGWVYVVDPTIGVLERVVRGSDPEWFDDHTLTVGRA